MRIVRVPYATKGEPTLTRLLQQNKHSHTPVYLLCSAHPSRDARLTSDHSSWRSARRTARRRARRRTRRRRARTPSSPCSSRARHRPARTRARPSSGASPRCTSSTSPARSASTRLGLGLTRTPTLTLALTLTLTLTLTPTQSGAVGTTLKETQLHDARTSGSMSTQPSAQPHARRSQGLPTDDHAR